MRTYSPPVPFGAVLALLGVGTVIGVGVAVVLQEISLVPVVLGVALAVGFVYLFLTTARGPAPVRRVTDDEPFDDPVEEADRMGEAVPPAPATAATAPSSSPASEEDEGYDPVEEAARGEGARSPASPRNDPK